jgi:hypothetical protein
MSFSCSDKDALIAYVYGECDSSTRDAVEIHLTTCPSCADEVAGFGMVRQTLTEWAAPERVGQFRLVRDEAGADDPPAKVLRPARWWQAPLLPGLARVAAAVLLFAGGAALANLDVRYDKDGLVVRTGWHQAAVPAEARAEQRPAPPAQAPVSAVPASTEPGPSPWRTELASLERQLRDEFRSQIAAVKSNAAPQPLQPVQVSAAANGFDENRFMQRVHTLLEESERRQQIEMAYRISQVMTDVQSQRRADMLRVQQTVGGILEVPSPQQRRQLMDNLFPVSLKR